MSLAAGTELGPYLVTAFIGRGGMGEVYRARDARLRRDVALKILPAHLSGDSDRLARFEREAQVLASLNHPHIAQIYGVEETGGFRALVMELVDGPTLADRIARGPLALDEVLAIGIEIAEALEAAHERGIVHRDLKPANIKLAAGGAVKVLDFGLAKALEPDGSFEAMDSPTITARATELGVLLGTAAYMAPEQARGRSADRRADIWALGVVLFEMLAGRRPFAGDDVSGAIAEILKSEPAWDLLPAETPASVRRLLRRCLRKEPRDRLQHIGDARLDLQDARVESPVDLLPRPSRVSGGERFAWAAGAVLLAAAAMIAARWTGTADEPAETRLEITTPPTPVPTSFTISPDGRRIVFTAFQQGVPRLFVRSLDTTFARELPGTERGTMPFWSPDSRSIGYFTDNKLMRLDVDGGDPQELAPVLTPAGGSWGGDTILYVPADNGPVYQVRAHGGTPERVTPERTPQLATRFPHVLPDGRRFLFHVARGAEPPGVYVGELGSDAIHQILTADGPAVYGLGHLFFVRQGILRAQAFDPGSLELRGPVLQVALDVVVGAVSRMGVSVSPSGPIAYRTGAQGRRRLVWFDRGGNELGAVEDERLLPLNPSLAPDGRRLVINATMQENVDLWIVDLERGGFERLTHHPDIEAIPLWSPDGTRILYTRRGLYLKRLDGSADDELLLSIPREPGPSTAVRVAPTAVDWSRDGKYVLYRSMDSATARFDLWALPLEGNRTPFPVVQTPFEDRDGQFSPDGKWIAYQSDDSGQPEVYVQPFPGPGARIRVSAGGGTQVRWHPDGNELFYIESDNRLMAVPILAAGGGLRPGLPKPLFETQIVGLNQIARQQYVVSPDGQRFLINSLEGPTAAPITVILNWKPAVRP